MLLYAKLIFKYNFVLFRISICHLYWLHTLQIACCISSVNILMFLFLIIWFILFPLLSYVYFLYLLLLFQLTMSNNAVIMQISPLWD